MINQPKIFEVVVFALLAALCASIAYVSRNLEPVRWWQILLVLFAVIFLATALVTGINWIVFNAIERFEQANRARLEPVIALAKAMKGLSIQQTELLARYDIPAFVDQYTGQRVVHLLRCTDGNLVDKAFIADFLRQSLKRPGYLHPVREHQVFKDWIDTERLCRSVTNSLIHWGMATKAVGNRPAETIFSIDVIAEKLEVEL